MRSEIKTSRVTAVLAALLLLGAAAGLSLTGCGDDHDKDGQAKEEQFYTCGMHPQVIQNKPGNCPICGMKLTPVRKQGGAPGATAPGARKVKYYESTMNPGETSPIPARDSMGMDMAPIYETEDGGSDARIITVEPMTVQNMNIRTATVTRGPLRRVVRTVGVIEYNEPGLADVTTKFKGWVEQLYVNTTGQQVRRGEPLFEIYSPELYSAQREYVLALEGTNAPGGAALKGSARTKLRFFDISDEQIAELERTREPRKTLRIVSPQDGFVVEKAVVAGQMVDPGMRLYRLADLGLVWVQAQVYEQDLAHVRLGQEATVTLSCLPDREFRGRVTYVYPDVDEKTRTARIRMEFHNPGFLLKPGMFATVRILSELAPSVLLVPGTAVLRSGERNTVFVALAEGRFEPRTVTLGPQAEDDTWQVLTGLCEGERIVTSGQFLLDSESQLREAIQKMSGPKAAAPAASHEGHTAMPATTAPAAAQTNIINYTCPMTEHSDVLEPKPGKCPKCGMTLIPVMEQPKPVTQPLTLNPQPFTLYTCPMASHADVVSGKPGECSRCGMELVPASTVEHRDIVEANWRKQHPPAAQPTHKHQH